MFTNVNRGLFEKDKIIFSFLIATSILREKHKIDETIWNLFLRGPSVFTSAERSLMLESPDLLMCNRLSWETLYCAELRSAGQFEGLC